MSASPTGARTVAPDTLRSRHTATDNAARCAVLRATEARRRADRSALAPYAHTEGAR